MIIATFPHRGESLTVEVLDVYDGSNGRKLASVRALSGEPFTCWTHGGWATGSLASVPVFLLREVAATVDLPGLAIPAGELVTG